MSPVKSYIYGPVPSRRLGRSLGVDLVPFKVCTYDCIYCQLGKTNRATIERKPYIPSKEILGQLYGKLDKGIDADCITLAGSGEPTLNSNIELIIRDIKTHTDIPVFVLTNGSLLSDPRVRQSILKADAILPSLDAHDSEGFKAINRPHMDISFESVVKGLIEFRREYDGEINLEILLIEGINAADADAEKFKHWIKRINPDKIHINTAVRPAAETYARQISIEEIVKFCKILGKKAEGIIPFQDNGRHSTATDIKGDILDLISRRPCSVNDISSGLNTHNNEVLKHLEPLVKTGMVDRVERGGKVYYQTNKIQSEKK